MGTCIYISELALDGQGQAWVIDVLGLRLHSLHVKVGVVCRQGRKRLSMADLVGLTFSMMMTGYEPVSSAISTIVYLITAHPEKEEELLKELKVNDGLQPAPGNLEKWPYAMVCMPHFAFNCHHVFVGHVSFACASQFARRYTCYICTPLYEFPVGR
jgi:hypothetical protein